MLIAEKSAKMKITKRQLRRIIKEEKVRLLREASAQGAVEEADRVIMELFDTYVDKHLDGVGSNQEEAIYLAAQDLQEFFGGYSTDELERNYEVDKTAFGIS